MYILNAKIENIRSICRFELSFKPGECPGWHVLIGDNGAGKTTVVRALALGLIGSRNAADTALGQEWRTWVSQRQIGGAVQTQATVRLMLQLDENFDLPNGQTSTLTSSVAVSLRGLKAITLKDDTYGRLIDKSSTGGLFSASFGPFRRFTGGDPRYDNLRYARPRLGGHLSAFGEDVAFTHIIPRLSKLRFQELEDEHGEAALLLNDIRQFIKDTDLLPHNTALERITSDEVVFRDGNGCDVDINQLSDGYRSALSLTFELIFQLITAYGREKVFVRDGDSGKPQIDLPGVVIVDEIDAHLHPTWQRRIGKWFTERFPKLQFIVTTHSPLVCQAAEKGSVWRLPTPGVEDDGGRITGTELNRLIYGNVLEAYGTEAFGSDVNRSETSKEKLRLLAELNQKSLRNKLSGEEESKLAELRSILPTSAGTVDTTEGEIR